VVFTALCIGKSLCNRDRKDCLAATDLTARATSDSHRKMPDSLVVSQQTVVANLPVARKGDPYHLDIDREYPNMGTWSQLTGVRTVSSDFEDDLDLNTLNDEELTEQVHDDLYNGLREEVVEATNILLSRGWTAGRVLDDALVEGMRIVGVDFRDGILFVPEVLLAANAMKGGMEILRPLLAETGVEPIGKMVIGTVKGDIHDIGKNLVAMMMEGAGFEVIDLGINNPVEKYLAALEEHKPDILGLSALLTTTMPYMKVVIDTLKEKGLRSDYIVLVGGAPLNEEFGKAVGADAYCRDAGIAVETAKTLIAARRAAAAA
jgi:methylmalonyl-CoA mutase cobalamin-binding domain/chain